jgi:hypothetical protein
MLQEGNDGRHHHAFAIGATHINLNANRILKSWPYVTGVIAVNY